MSARKTGGERNDLPGRKESIDAAAAAPSPSGKRLEWAAAVRRFAVA